jgi:hypothetical protein
MNGGLCGLGQKPLATSTARSAGLTAVLLIGLLWTVHAQAQQLLDQFEDALHFQTTNGWFRTQLTGLLDLEGYYIDQRAPGLIYADHSFVNPRATFFLDTTLGPHLYSFVQARVDRGFDPGTRDAEARLDEYLLRWTPWADNRVNLQLGKFATVVGSWVQRHDSWQNPFITAPLPYENLTTVSDDPPGSLGAFLARRGHEDDKEAYLPAVWGPVYATGGSVFGSIGKFDYAFDVKNAALAEHPEQWSPNDMLWRYPTVSGRLGYRPSPAWNSGVSFSIGPYLYEEAQVDLPKGHGLGDYDQITLASDLSFALRHWQWWAELFLTRFEVPNVGNADLLSYYAEAKYSITPSLFAAARWNQQLYGSIPNGLGGVETWDSDMLRADVALGYRFTRHLQTKIQYSYGHRAGAVQQGEQLVAAQVTLRF